jgi:catalase
MHTSLKAALLSGTALLGLSLAACPFADPAALKERRDDGSSSGDSRQFLSEYEVDDSNGYMTSDVAGPISDQTSLKAGIRGSTLLEDFIFRQKIQHFDHERVSLLPF